MFLEKVGRFVEWRCVIAAHMIDRPSTLPLTTVCIRFSQYAEISKKRLPEGTDQKELISVRNFCRQLSLRNVDHFFFKVLLALLVTRKDINGKESLMSVLQEARACLQTLLLWRRDTAIHSSTKQVLGAALQNIGGFE
jgi:hypothetical protein